MPSSASSPTSAGSSGASRRRLDARLGARSGSPRPPHRGARQRDRGASRVGFRTKALELIENIDHLHRTAVWRLFEVLSELGGKGLVDRLVAEPAVKLLFVLYDLVPTEPLTPVESTGNVAQPLSSGFVPLSAIEGLNVAPTFRVAFSGDDLPAGSLRAVEVDGQPLLLATTETETFAYRNQCLGSILPLHLGTLVGREIHCPWHACRYNVTTGERLEGGEGRLEAFQVQRDGDIIRVSSGPGTER